MRYALFPTTAVLSTIARTKDGTTTEAATIGSEGMAGLNLVVREPTSPCRIVQEVEGEALQVPAEDLRAVWESSPRLREVLWRYAAAALYQSWQNTACGLRHCLNQRMCRWLLATADRVGDDGLCVTHECLAEILGVSRQRISITAAMLQGEGLISYRRGTLCIVDRGGLESYSCECYRTNREIYAWLMRDTAA
jgi:CRP-like cAMP-binding protein